MKGVYKLYIFIGILALAALWWITRKGNVAKLTSAVAQTTVEVATGAVTGTVEGIGQAVGVPVTSQDKCADAIRRRDGLDVSFYCPAGTFLEYEKDLLLGIDVTTLIPKNSAPIVPNQ